jgi:hypothetical protein
LGGDSHVPHIAIRRCAASYGQEVHRVTKRQTNFTAANAFLMLFRLKKTGGQHPVMHGNTKNARHSGEKPRIADPPGVGADTP